MQTSGTTVKNVNEMKQKDTNINKIRKCTASLCMSTLLEIIHLQLGSTPSQNDVEVIHSNTHTHTLTHLSLSPMSIIGALD